jgi:monoterpene epsilon-lactone hydrolase
MSFLILSQRTIQSITTALAIGFATPCLADAPPKNMLAWPLPDTLSPEAKVIAGAFANAPTPDQMPPLAEVRKYMEGMHNAIGAQMAKRFEVRVEASEIAGVPVRIIYPKGVTNIKGGPVLLNLHGGGFAVDSGSLTETIPIAAKTGIPVIAVLYRLAPEHPYPAALDDAHAVYRALAKDHKPSNMAVFGTSAGAALSVQLLARLTVNGEAMPAALGFFSGSADLTKKGDSESWMPTPNDEYLPKYLGGKSPNDPILSPLLGDLSRFPPTLSISSTRDFLLSPTSIFARALHERGKDSQLVVFDGLPHAFWSFMDIPEADQANEIAARFFKSKLLKK